MQSKVPIAAVVLAFNIFAMTGCDMFPDPDDPEPEYSFMVHSAIYGVTPPATGAAPVTNINGDGHGYSGTVKWSPAVSGTFAARTKYTATITLKAKKGYTLKGVPENYFYVQGAETITNAANSGVVTAVFPSTRMPVNIAVIQGLSVPAGGEVPATDITENEQYSGTVTWLPYVNGTFAADTAYTATITLTAKGDFTLQGVPKNFFTVEGAVTTNFTIPLYPYDESGEIIAVFPATGAAVVDMATIPLSAPVAGYAPQMWFERNWQYDVGAITWSPAVDGTFATYTEYTAAFTLTARPGCTFEGVPENFFIVEGATSVTNAANSGVITVRFPQTGAGAVNMAAILGIAVPATGDTPVTTITETEQYSGTVTWSPEVNGTFAADTTYIATITLTPKGDYTLQGVPYNFFTVAGTTSAWNDFSSGVVFAVFPQTDKIVNTGIQGLDYPVGGRTPVTAITGYGQYSGTVSWSPAVSGTFAAYTTYTATITLTPYSGYTFRGVPDNFFSIGVTTSVINTANSVVITAVFPQTTEAVINIAAIQGIDVPTGGGIPVTRITENEQYSGTVSWSPSVSNTVSGTFGGYTQYTATITLTPKSNNTLRGVAANFFTVAGAASVTHAANSGVITAVFPATGLTKVTIAALSGIAAPIVGGIPVTRITENEQYTGTVSWSPYPYSPSTFAASTVYTATVTLTAKYGYTLQGVTANFFTVAGATSVNNNANSGVITAMFPVTGTSLNNRLEYYWVDEHGSLVTTSGGKTTVGVGRTLTITAQGTGYIVKQWHLNGINTGQSGNTYTFSSEILGSHTVGLFVEKDGCLYNTNITITTVPIYTVTFDINGGTGTAPAPQTVAADSPITIPPQSGFSRAGLDFGGWNTNASGTGTNYNAGFSYTPAGNITLYARWGTSNSNNPYSLYSGTWNNGSITSGTDIAVWYSFSVTYGTTYYIWWNDSFQGNGAKTLNIMVDAVYSNGTAIFTGADSAYNSALFFTASQTGTVKLKVYPYANGNTGTFAVTYSTRNTRP